MILSGTKRSWSRIKEDERQQLEAAVGFGLPVDFAGKIIMVKPRNFNRIMREQI